MIRSILLVCCLVAVSATGAQTFSENFNEGIPASFTVYDRDGLVPNQSMGNLGFKTGQGWIAYSLKDEQGIFATSTSKYESTGTSDDWLVTPEIYVPSQGVWMEWKAISCSKTSKAAYKVLISASGIEPGNFTETPVFEIEEEEGIWTSHSVSLDRYEGKKIHIAFVNCSTDKYLLGIDDIQVGRPERISGITSTTPSYIDGAQGLGISGKITANYSQGIDSFTAMYKSEDKTVTQEFSGLAIGPGEEYEFSFTEKLPGSPGDTVSYSIVVKIEGEEYTTAGKTVCYVFLPERMFVLEEGTGTWCGYCPAGHVALDYMRETYPDEVIPIAVHNEDPMTVKIYDGGLYSLGIDGYPIGFINRKYKSQPMGRDMTPGNGGWETAYLNAKEEQAPASFDLKVSYADEAQNTVRFQTKAKFALNLSEAKYNIAYIVKECNVKGTTVKYNQNNSYSGSDKSVGGFEQLPASVPASVMVYHDVARAIKPSFKGDRFIDKAVKAGDEIESDYLFDLPSTVLNKDNLSFIALLLNAETGEIVNAATCRFHEHAHEGLATGVEPSILNKTPEILIGNDGSELVITVKLENASAMTAGIYDLNGTCLSEKATVSSRKEHALIMPVIHQKGIYFLKITVGAETFVKKMIL